MGVRSEELFFSLRICFSDILPVYIYGFGLLSAGDSFQWEIVRCLWITEINCEVHDGEKPTSRDSELLRKKLDFINLRAILIYFLGSLLFAEVLFTCSGSVVHIV